MKGHEARSWESTLIIPELYKQSKPLRSFSSVIPISKSRDEFLGCFDRVHTMFHNFNK